MVGQGQEVPTGRNVGGLARMVVSFSISWVVFLACQITCRRCAEASRVSESVERIAVGMSAVKSRNRVGPNTLILAVILQRFLYEWAWIGNRFEVLLDPPDSFTAWLSLVFSCSWVPGFLPSFTHSSLPRYFCLCDLRSSFGKVFHFLFTVYPKLITPYRNRASLCSFESLPEWSCLEGRRIIGEWADESRLNGASFEPCAFFHRYISKTSGARLGSLGR